MSARAQAARGAGRIQWGRVGRIALVLVLFAILASYVSPALNFFDAWRDSKAEHASLTELRAENAQLRGRITALDGKDAAEREARQLGMVGEFEGAYVVRGLQDE